MKKVLASVLVLGMTAMVFMPTKASAMPLVNLPYLTVQQFTGLKEKFSHGDIKAAKRLARLYLHGFTLGSCVKPDPITGKGIQKLLKMCPKRDWKKCCPQKQVVRDYTEAFKYMKLAADAGDAWAQTYMGWFYERGKVVNKNYTTALKWYRLAADQGYPDAEDLMGTMYCVGHGIPKNYEVAAEFYKKALLQYKYSSGSLAFLYFTGGPGLPKNYEKAYFWLNVIDSGWLSPDKLLSDLSCAADNLWLDGKLRKLLTPAQIQKIGEQIKSYKMPPPTKWTPRYITSKEHVINYKAPPTVSIPQIIDNIKRWNALHKPMLQKTNLRRQQ